MKLISSLGRLLGISLVAVAATVQAATTVGAQDQKLTPEEQVKLEKLTAFLKKSDEFLPTVNVIDPKTLPITFPFDLVLDHIVVDVAFGSGKALPFMFDTGAPTYITPSMSKELGGETVIETVAVAGGGKLLWSPLEKFPSLTIENTLTLTDPTAQAGWVPSGALYCVTPHGLLGAPAMRNAVWQVNYRDEKITVAASADQLDNMDGAIKLPFSVKANTLSPTPMIELGVGNGKLTFLVDTGGGIPLTINTEDLAKIGIEVPPDAPLTANLAGGAAGSFETRLAAMQLPIKIGDTEITTTVFVGDGMAPTAGGNMGHFFLRNYTVTFDFPGKMMYLKPLAGDGSIESLSDAPAAGIGLSDGKLIVSSIAVDGPAEKAGLKLGDPVSAVDGQNVENITMDAFCDLRGKNPTTITTASGETYDISPIKGFFDGKEK